MDRGKTFLTSERNSLMELQQTDDFCVLIASYSKWLLPWIMVLYYRLMISITVEHI